jgi:heme exporter protein C
LFFVQSLDYVNPWCVLPYVPSLGEKLRILNFHVPVAWIAVLAYLLSMFYSIRYLRRGNAIDDIKASSSAALGTMFCILATVTGMLWAKFNWGHFWNWDPRETSIFILLMIYFAYFTLRAAIDREDLRAKLSAVYDILAAVTVPFFIFILPRITTGLHPGSASEDTSGPVLSAQSEMLNMFKQFTFALAFGAFTAFFFWLLNLLVRLKSLKVEIVDRDYE